MIMESGAECVIKVCSSKLKLEELIKKINELNKGANIVQIFDKAMVINKIHIIGAYINSVESFTHGANIAKNPALELLLYAAMTRQINNAIKRIGAKSNKGFVLFCNSKASYITAKKLVSNESEFKPTHSESLKVAKKYGITQVNDLNQFILQKMALSRIEY